MKTTNLDFRFSKEYARSQMNLWGKLLCWTGVAKMYLDEGDWKPHFRLLHPLSWIVVFIFSVSSILKDFVEIFRLLRVDKNSTRHLWMSDAPEYVHEEENFLTAPMEVADIFAAKNHFQYFCLWVFDETSRVLVKTGYPCIYRDSEGDHVLYVSEIEVREVLKAFSPTIKTALVGGKTSCGKIVEIPLHQIISA